MTEIFSITLEQKGGRRGSQVCLIQAAWSLWYQMISSQSLCIVFSFPAQHWAHLFNEDEGKWWYSLPNDFDWSRPTAVTFSLSSKDLEPLCPQEHLNTQMLSKLRGYIITKVKCAIETAVAVSCKDNQNKVHSPSPQYILEVHLLQGNKTTCEHTKNNF